MVSNVLRDAALDPIVQEIMVPFDQYWETVRDVIADAFEASGERHEALLGAIALAQDFQTWRTLVRQQELSQDRAVELMEIGHTSELQSRQYLVCRLLLEKKKK